MMSNVDRYQRIAPFYDLLDLPFERKRYQALRPLMFQNLGGQLLDAGIPARNISDIGLCTSCRTDLFFSHRAEKGVTGRMMAAVGIAP